MTEQDYKGKLKERGIDDDIPFKFMEMIGRRRVITDRSGRVLFDSIIFKG